ncbi:MAG TPA: 2-succinyl-5-enolpyruvyl-6-hydroxy-3-cyclohexene-1-carboxylic-acid synthase [Rhodothermales bacterium]|nr:2-succinyl-5-enolpyruvyl-6-hydroxy-3-cyclohexene-1-carboxylic-acid synthase [Rhodothermales bacterium]
MTAFLNRLWATLLVEELKRQGVTFVAVAPGSRSAPLALAVAESGIPHVVHYDERGVAFLALGHARVTNKPAAVVTTSGTAVANLYPAVVEADADGVPLLLLTADRPPELRATGANQTIDQVKVFGDRVRWYYELPTPGADVDPALVLTTAGTAVRHALHLPSGPVHLNVPFREPLVPGPDDPPAEIPAHIAAWRAADEPYTLGFTEASPHGSLRVADEIADFDAGRIIERGLVVAGRLDSHVEAADVAVLAERLGWPLLPDVRSFARVGRVGYGSASFYDHVLLSERFAEAHRPEAVLLVGDMPLSKRLLTFLAETRPRLFIVARDGPGRLDPMHRVTLHVAGRVLWFIDRLLDDLASLPQAPTSAWKEAWMNASHAVAREVAAMLDRPETLSEPFVTRTVARMMPDGEALVLGSSMPVRDVDFYGPADRMPVTIVANRGASGIDGTVATAAGAARGDGGGATLLLGDLALLHDLNSLALLREGPRVVVVVLNNDGGGIFSFLPVAKHAQASAFERMFGTPHGLDFRGAAEMFGLTYEVPETPKAFLEAYKAALARSTSSVIEVRTDRAANHALHLDLQARVRAAVDALVP